MARIGRTSLTMEHAAVRRDSGDLAVEGISTLVVFDYASHAPVPVPDEIRRAIVALEGRDL